jgi:hypothetical protein
VTADNVLAVTRKWLQKRRAVTGFLLPKQTAEGELASGGA